MSTGDDFKRLQGQIAQTLAQGSRKLTATTAEFMATMIGGDSDSDVDLDPLLRAMALANVRLPAFGERQDALAHDFFEKRAARKAGVAKRAQAEAEVAWEKARGLIGDAA